MIVNTTRRNGKTEMGPSPALGPLRATHRAAHKFKLRRSFDIPGVKSSEWNRRARPPCLEEAAGTAGAARSVDLRTGTIQHPRIARARPRGQSVHPAWSVEGHLPIVLHPHCPAAASAAAAAAAVVCDAQRRVAAESVRACRAVHGRHQLSLQLRCETAASCVVPGCAGCAACSPAVRHTLETGDWADEPRSCRVASWLD